MTDPAGHSFGAPHEPPTAFDPRAWRACEPYLFGCDLFNHGYYWEAHEAWESLWRGCPPGSTEGRFLQGLIQVSAACLKAEVGEVGGVARLLVRARTNLHNAIDLSRPGARYAGLAVAAWFLLVERASANPAPIVLE